MNTPCLMSTWLLMGLFFVAPLKANQNPEATAKFVGGNRCAACHESEYEKWRGSHHELAMQLATNETVLGNFDNSQFSYAGTTSRFFKRESKFFVNTDGPDGKLADFEILYTFGVFPLQQYLVALPEGRLQALSIAWDSRPEAEGGQRWFHLYPGEVIAHEDPLHWTGISQNWNSMCAECHSTNLKKNYDPSKRAFSTIWSEVNVSCEACHGPGSRHVDWAERNPGWESHTDKGLSIALDEREDVRWTIDKATGNAQRSIPRESEHEIQMCARCHSRRGVISEDYVHGRPLMDTHLPRLLDEGMYYADGQILDEVYVYGSFLQSKMYQAGVTCSNCHDPHSLTLRAPGDQVCSQCHAPSKYASETHHHHESDSAGASCTACHMPAKVYMVVDPRRDHSFRIPRPELSVTLGTPNACTQCHRNQSDAWAAQKAREWYGHDPVGHQKFGPALHSARNGDRDAGQKLLATVKDTATPAIARASAMAQLREHLSRESLDAIQRGLSDTDPLVRRASVQALEGAPPQIRVPLVFPLANDPLRAVRIEAASVLADLPAGGLAREEAATLKEADAEYIAAQMAVAERPEAHLNLGNFHARKRKPGEAEAAYREAIALQTDFIPAYVNLADLYRALDQDEHGERILRQALAVAPQAADVHHSLGLLLVRQKKTEQSLEHLRRAVELSRDNPRYIYVYAVALHSTGRKSEAVDLLQTAIEKHPGDRDLHAALIAFKRDAH